MRNFLFGSIAVLLLAMLMSACSWVDPADCYPNTSGGFGGSGTIPIGAGVGAAGTGDFDSPPPTGGTSNPCVTPDTPEPPPPQSACQAPTPSGDKATSWSCGDACSSKCPAPGRGTFVSFNSLEFPFVTTIQDDGAGKGGGWQEAKANLEFVQIHIPSSIISWWCPITIGMPLRTEGMGKISTSLAASLSIEITVGVARDMDFSLPQGIFCYQFVLGARDAFKSKYPLLGAKVQM